MSIIGVVAAITIPSLVVKNQEKETVVRLKKAYSTLSNAFSLAQTDYGSFDDWNWIQGSAESSNEAVDKISNYLNIQRICYQSSGCFGKNVVYKNYDGTPKRIMDASPYNTTFSIADGTLVDIWSAGTNNMKASISVDVNGQKGPNTYGKDTFSFYLINNKLLPAGYDLEIDKGCLATTNKGEACTAWAIIKENLQYPSNIVEWPIVDGN